MAGARVSMGTAAARLSMFVTTLPDGRLEPGMKRRCRRSTAAMSNLKSSSI
jgi:hypothetical protein